MSEVFLKDPNADLNYEEDWSDWLGDDDTIATSDWAAESGLTVGATDKTSTTTIVNLSDGIHGQEYLAKNSVSTTNGLSDSRSIKILCRHR